MDTAYELETKKFIKAWVIGRDASYIMPEKDIFIANKDEIINYNEVLKKNKKDYIEVRYKKGHERNYKNGKSSVVVPHFFILNKSKLGIETTPETPEHKKIKSFIYEHFFDSPNLELVYSKYKRKKELIYNNIMIKDLPIKWEDFSLKKEDIFEINISDSFNTRRVDVFLKFKEFHPLFGEGLVIEVQLSPQSSEKTKERTIERCLKGYSCIWINKHHFQDVKADDLKLKKDFKFIIHAWQNILYINAENIADNINTKIKKYSRLIDEKCISSLATIKKSIFLQEGMLCPLCKVGQLVKKKGSKGSFLGCSKFPKCKQTYNITYDYEVQK